MRVSTLRGLVARGCRIDAVAFVAWVRQSKECAWALHEVAGKGCSEPREPAALLLTEIGVETADERAWKCGRG